MLTISDDGCIGDVDLYLSDLGEPVEFQPSYDFFIYKLVNRKGYACIRWSGKVTFVLIGKSAQTLTAEAVEIIHNQIIKAGNEHTGFLTLRPDGRVVYVERKTPPTSQDNQ